jgi:RNA polymerase sigma-70 factor (ECF subfamily)
MSNRTLEAFAQGLLVTSSAANPESETAQLIRRARSGDQEAFSHLVVRHQRMVFRTGLRILGRLDLAQDAAQEAFLRLYRHLARFDESRELGPWLYRVVVNVCRDVSRASRTPQVVSLDEAPELMSAQEDVNALEQAVVLDQQRRLVQAALLTLPLKEREAVVLRDIEGLATAEVAQILGSSQGTVRSQISTGRLKIKRYLEATMGIRR